MANKRASVSFEPAALSVEDAAKYCGVGLKHMWDLVQASKVDSRKDGRRTLVLTASLKQWLEALPKR